MEGGKRKRRAGAEPDGAAASGGDMLDREEETQARALGRVRALVRVGAELQARCGRAGPGRAGRRRSEVASSSGAGPRPAGTGGAGEGDGDGDGGGAEEGWWLAALRFFDAALAHASGADDADDDRRGAKRRGKHRHLHLDGSSLLPPLEEADVRARCALLLLTHTSNVGDAAAHSQRALALLGGVRRGGAHVELKLKTLALSAAANRLLGKKEFMAKALEKGGEAAAELAELRLKGARAGAPESSVAVALSWRCHFAVELAAALRSSGELRRAVDQLSAVAEELRRGALRAAPGAEGEGAALAVDARALRCGAREARDVSGSYCRLVIAKYQLLVDLSMLADMSGGGLRGCHAATAGRAADGTGGAAAAPSGEEVHECAGGVARALACLRAAAAAEDAEAAEGEEGGEEGEREREASGGGGASEVAALGCHVSLIEAAAAAQGGRVDDLEQILADAVDAWASAPAPRAASHRNAVAMSGNDRRSVEILLAALGQLRAHANAAAAAAKGAAAAPEPCNAIEALLSELVPGARPGDVVVTDGGRESELPPQRAWLARTALPLHLTALAHRCSALLLEADLPGAQAALERVVSACQRFPTLLATMRWLPAYLCGVYLMNVVGCAAEAVDAMAAASAIASRARSSARFAVAAMHAVALVLRDAAEEGGNGGGGRAGLSAASTILSGIRPPPQPSAPAPAPRLDNYSECAAQLARGMLSCRGAAGGGDQTSSSRKALRLAHKSLKNQQLTSVCLTVLGAVEVGRGSRGGGLSDRAVQRGHLKDAADYFKSATTLSRHLRDLPTSIVAFDGVFAANAAIHAHDGHAADALPEACTAAARQAAKRRAELGELLDKARGSASHARILDFVRTASEVEAAAGA